MANAAHLCETAAAAAELEARLPAGLLTAISLTESGRIEPATSRTRAWPWTIDAGGEGRFFETRQDAIAAVKALRARGVTSIDVGCMQVNLAFHPNAFASLEDAFDPMANARYAARFLTSLYASSRSWAHAIAAYHSETPALGEAYRILVLTRWQGPALREQPVAPPASPYGAFAPRDQVYGAFAPASRVYGAFTPAR